MTTKNLSQFLKDCSHTDTLNLTNTRIGKPELGIYGGKYAIDEDKEDEFFTLYANEINKGKKEYITETQLLDNSAILIDIDMRFDYSVKTRLYTEKHIDDLKNLYLDELKKMYQFDEQAFRMYIFEKTKVNSLEEKKITKDGVHIIIGIKTEHKDQLHLREKVMSQMADLWKDLPLVNKWDEVFDMGISTGKTNWQLYGSTKPEYEPYKLTKIYKVVFNDDEDNFVVEKEVVPATLTVDLLKKVSARCRTHPFYFFKNDYINTCTESSKGQTAAYVKNTRVMDSKLTDANEHMLSVLSIQDHDMLKSAVEAFLTQIEVLNFDLRETYDYTMALPEKYYGSGSYPYWIKVGLALRNIDDRLFIVWVAMSAKWEHFSFSGIYEMYDFWKGFDSGNRNGLTRRSIMHWVKTDNPAEYNNVRNTSIEYHINESLKNPKCGDVDIANVLYEFYKDQYVCTSIRGDTWFHFCEHRWKPDERGTSLRQHISEELRSVYIRLATEKKQKGMGMSDEEKEKIAPFISKIQEVIKKLGQTTEKDHIMKEAKEKFYDKGGVFMHKLDTNPYILCFTNGVVDFKENVFRDGRPEDCVSKCTNLKYTYLDENNLLPAKQTIVNEINDFMHKLFPIQELYEYMWEHLASILIGTSLEQTFHMYIGKGRNGKSVLMDLMGKTLGDYKGDVNLSIITSTRVKVGGLNPELVELKGVRYAVMSEPSPDEKINVGPMKMLTGGKDIIQCRAPYMPQMLCYNPQFKLCVCTNTLMKINSLDDGTWRRIRVVEFMSLFTEKPVDGDADKPYQFKVEEIDQKFDVWKEIFISMLVNVAKRTGGAVRQCGHVMHSSNAYKGEQDYIGTFIDECIVALPEGRITQMQLRLEFERWYASMFDERTKPNPKSVYEYFDKKYGKRTQNQPWKGISIVRYEDSDAGKQNRVEETFESS